MTEQSNRLILHTNSRDEVFAEEHDSVADFSFNSTVANVFDDMVSRSVPFYGEMQRMVCELARDFAQPQSKLYDIGCSTATTLLALDREVDNHIDFVGIDNAPEMLKKAAEKIAESGTNRSIDLQTADLHRGFSIEKASVVTMVLTLQFVRPLFRERAIQAVDRARRL